MNIHSSSFCNSSQTGTTQMPVTQYIYKMERYSMTRLDNLQIHDTLQIYVPTTDMVLYLSPTTTIGTYYSGVGTPTVCWRRLLRVPWTARRSSQSILKEISPEYSLDVLMLKLNLQYFDHLMWRADSLEKPLMLGKTEGKRRRGRQRTRWLDSITNSTHMNLSKLGDSERQGSLACCSPWGHKELDTT